MSKLRARERKPSLQARLIALVCFVTLLPFLAGQFFSSRRFADTVGRDFREQARLGLQRTDVALSATLASYEDFLYQLYTDDAIVGLVDKLALGVDEAVSRNQLRRQIQGQAYAKPYLQAITLIFEDGSTLYYDKLTASATRSAWLSGWDAGEMFEQVAFTSKTHYFPTAYAMDVSGVPTYLFHLAHRVIDYRDIEKRRAIIVLSVDETLLYELSGDEWVHGGTTPTMFHLLTTPEGLIVSGPQKRLIGTLFTGDGAAFARENDIFTTNSLSTESIENELTGWTLYQLRDQSELYSELSRQQQLNVWIMLGSVLLLVGAIVLLIRLLTSSIGKVTSAMTRAGAGDLTSRVAINARMPRETATIALRFNAMMDEINALMNDVREASIQQSKAEIAALEAQINPHFLYNTLDTINWMAIDNDEYDISNAISALGRILRYGIERSNGIVTVREELEWLKQYLSLQQIRLKNSLDFRLEVSEEALSMPIHKMLFQPFVENAIIHGFEGVKRAHLLRITIARTQDGLSILIEDNGKGMSPEQLEALNACDDSADKHHLGVKNALGRIRMYYGDGASVTVSSKPGEGTSITLMIPTPVEAEE